MLHLLTGEVVTFVTQFSVTIVVLTEWID